jgi:hypothetical protein
MSEHWDAILENVAFPLMCFSEEDAELWAEDPQEYVRKVCVVSCYVWVLMWTHEYVLFAYLCDLPFFAHHPIKPCPPP